MNDSIKILEEIIEYCKEHLPPYYKDEDLHALENLIKGYRELEENLKIATAMLTKGQYPEINKGDNDFNKQFVPKSKIKEIRDKAEVMDYYVLGDVIEDLNKLLGDEK